MRGPRLFRSTGLPYEAQWYLEARHSKADISATLANDQTFTSTLHSIGENKTLCVAGSGLSPKPCRLPQLELEVKGDADYGIVGKEISGAEFVATALEMDMHWPSVLVGGGNQSCTT